MPKSLLGSVIFLAKKFAILLNTKKCPNQNGQGNFFGKFSKNISHLGEESYEIVEIF
jgi:hypothetical protein